MYTYTVQKSEDPISEADASLVPPQTGRRGIFGSSDVTIQSLKAPDMLDRHNVSLEQVISSTKMREFR